MTERPETRLRVFQRRNSRTWIVRAASMLALAIAAAPVTPAAAQEVATAEVHGDQPGPRYNRQLFGQFAEHLGNGIYGGIWVGKNSRIPNIAGYRKDVVDALRELKVPLIRWPGGCFADEYHWREGIGPQAKRPVKINTNWGGVTEPNTVGTHEFMNFAEMVGAQSYVSGNVGSSEPREMAEWVEYMTSPTGSSLAKERAENGRAKPWAVAYFGIGNELWGCGGNMTPEYAADMTRRYAAFLKLPSGSAKIASGANADDYNWTEVMMRQAGKYIDGIGVHYYTVPGTWEAKGSATRFDEAQYAATIGKTLKMDELLTRHSAIMDRYDPQRRVALLVDEWGTWFDAEPGTNPGFLYQQNSVRDALVAAINLNIFAAHAERVKGANIAQMVNVLQAMILTKDDKMVRTPTYHVFDMYKAYQDATVLPVTLKSPWYNKDQWSVPAVSASAVRDGQGAVHVGLTNVDPDQSVVVTLTLDDVQASSVSGRVLTGPAINSINTFDQPDVVVPAVFSGATITGKTLTVTMPPHAVVMLDVR